MRKALWILFSLAAFVAQDTAHAGRIRALNGENYNGEISISGTNRLTIAVSANSQREVDLYQISTATLNSGSINFSDYTRLPEGWTSRDIGDVNLTGSVGVSNRTFAMRTAAMDVGDRSDNCQFVSFVLRGDGELVARVWSIEGADRFAKVGVMLREKSDAGSRFAMLSANGHGGVSWQYRAQAHQKSIDHAPIPARLPCWLKLTRRGKVITSAFSLDGRDWKDAGSAMLDVDPKCSIGIALTSHSSFAMASTLIDNVRLTQHGLLGEYFSDADFKELRFARVDPQVNFSWGNAGPAEGAGADHFSVRWTGQIEPKTTGRYVLVVDADDSADLWIDDVPAPRIPFKKESSRNPTSFALVGGKRYDLKLEYRELTGSASVRLGWAGVGRSGDLISTASLFCTLDVQADKPGSNGTNSAGLGQAKGIYLRSGSFLSGTVKSVTEANVTFSYQRTNEYSVAPNKVRKIVLQVPPRGTGSDPTAGRTGLLLRSGEFFEGEITGLAGEQIRLSSVLFGFRKFNLADVCVILTSDAADSPARFAVQLLDGSSFQFDTLYPKGENLVLIEPILGAFRVPQSSVVEIRNPAGRMVQDLPVR